MKNTTFFLTAILFLGFIMPGINADACTIFKWCDKNHVFVGNNEDFNNDKTYLWTKKKTADTYACVFLGYADEFPQGGINEKGLVYDWVAHEPVEWKSNNSTCTLKGYLCERLLEKCSSVKEVIEYYKKCDEISFGTAHIMWTDKKGHSAVIGFDNGRLSIRYDSSDFQIYGYGERKINNETIKEYACTPVSCRKLLETSVQKGKFPTQYSIIYDLSEMKIRLFNSQQFNKESVFSFDQLLSLSGKTRLKKVRNRFK